MNDPLAAMLRYNAWATLTLLESCRTFDDAVLDARGPGTSGSVRELLVHLVGAQQTFVLRTKGRQHEGELNRRSAWPGIETLIEIARETGDQLIAVARDVTEDRDIELSYMGKSHRIPVSFFLVHAVEHGVEHRTEVKVALAARGIETPDLDGWAYASASGIGREA